VRIRILLQLSIEILQALDLLLFSFLWNEC